MAAINANIVVDTTTLTVSPTTNNLGVTVEPINLNVYSGGSGTPGGNNNELQFNDNNAFNGVPNTSVSGGNLTFTNLANLKINGGVNGYVLETDGTGVLSWTAQTGGGGTGSPGGADSQIQYNDNGVFGGIAGFTLNDVSGIVSMPTDLNVVSDITTTSGAFFGDGGGLSNVVGANVTGEVSFAATANAVAGANVSGQVANALVAGTVYTAAQSNITSTGTLTGLTVAGTTSIQQAKEKVIIETTAAAGNIDLNLLDGAVIYNTTDATNDYNLLLRGNATTTLTSVMSTGESLTFTFINTNGATAYVLEFIYIDGFIQTPKWLIGATTGAPGTGTINGVDAYTINVIKTGATTFDVLAGRAAYS
jgi:hypothetical protein